VGRTVLNREQPIVIRRRSGREHESAIRLGRIGFDHVAGYLQDGLRSLESRPILTTTTERLSAPVAAERLSRSDPPLAVDVRTPGEREAKRIEGSVAIPLNHLIERLAELPVNRPLVCLCAAATDRRSLRACCSGTGSGVSARLPAACRMGNRQAAGFI